MKEKLQKYMLRIAPFLTRLTLIAKQHAIVILVCLFSFLLVFSGIYITASRNLAIRSVRWQMSRLIPELNEIGLDIAYDGIKFNAMFFSPLIKINNLQIYNTTGDNRWSVSFDEIKAYPNIFGAPKIRFESNKNGKFTFNTFSGKMTMDDTFLDISHSENKLSEIVFHADDINIKDLAKIKKISFLVEKLTSRQKTSSSSTLPSYESFFEVNDVAINGLINYPLSSDIKLIYAKSSLMGTISPEEHLLTSLETWLKDGGFIDVPNLIIQWEPLTLVGRGSVSFNETFSPKISFNTSSKGLLRLIDDLQKNEFLDSKNVFVANILLSNKAFKINSEDPELTITTPIGYSDGKITIENLTIKDFSQ